MPKPQMKPVCAALTDDDLESWNDASAAGWRDNRGIHIDASVLNCLICEIQAWRREHPLDCFDSGPNTIEPK